MELDWKQWCRLEKFPCAEDEIEVRLSTGRTQQIRVQDEEGSLLLTSIVVRQAATAKMDSAPLQAWERNRAVSLVGFRVDEKGRLVGSTWVPKSGLTREEFILVLEHLSSECDRFEYQLTGADRE